MIKNVSPDIELITPQEIPGFMRLVGLLRDHTYASTDRDDLNSRRFDMMSTHFKSWYEKVLEKNNEAIVDTFAKIKASMVIYDHEYDDDVMSTIRMLDDSVTKLIMK